jgi:glucose/arabinose dehydrogenase
MRGFLSRRALVAAVALAVAGAIIGVGGAIAIAQQAPYRTAGSCAGLPRIEVHTAPGYCVGLVAAGLKFPRGILPLPDGRILVAEMIGWGSGNGRVTALAPDGRGSYTKQFLAKRLDQPHGLALGPDGKVYIGVVGGVKRFSLADPAGSLEDVIGGKAAVAGPPGTGRHPLESLLFTKAGSLLVNVGSSTNNCETGKGDLPKADRPCPETVGDAAHGLVREYNFDWTSDRVTGWRVFADGLRNSMGLAQYPAGTLILQAENSRDSIDDVMPGLANDEDLPPDELNVLEFGGHYGWPYCYGANLPSPEYAKWDCSAYHAPTVELPAHAAPLGIAYWHGGLAVGYHGYRSHGHRLVWFPIDATGRPAGPAQELISDWQDPDGAPVDLKAGADGALYFSEDHNGTVLRLVAE